MSSKRRSGAAGTPEDFAPTPDPKRRKRNDDTHFPDVETAKTTTENGLKLVRLLTKSQDKTGRYIAGHFLELPSKKDYPDYYQQIAMPISLNMIESRLEDGDYDNMEMLESDLKRLIQNAKEYNSSKSEVFEDAERIRKTLSNFMPKHNPAYMNPDYRAYPTPIPQNLVDRMRDSSVSTTGTGGPERVKLVFSKRRQSQPASTDGDEVDNVEDMKTKQLDLLLELSGQEDAVNFEEKPPKRDYPDYYKVIQQPTSISDVRNMVEKGKIPDWNSFTKEVRLIWDNAKEYNEPGSPIYEMAEELESWFEEKVQSVGAPPRVAQRLSLTAPKPKQLKLTMGSAASPILPNTENETMRRQSSSRGQNINGSTPAPASIANSLRRSVSTVDPPEAAMANANGTLTPQPSSIADSIRVQVASAQQIPTPAMEGDPPTANGLYANGHTSDTSLLPNTRNMFVESDNPLERKYRDPGKGIEDALLGSVTYMTHPNLPNDPKWKLSRYASATKTQSSSYIYLPADHYFLRLTPNLTSELKSRKKYKVCVTNNWQLIPENIHVPGSYDFQLRPGENVITVDVIAELKEGEKKDYAPPQLQLDFERITFYIILMERNLV